MEKKTPAAQRKHDLAGPDVFDGAACNLDYMARPKSGQHALPKNTQTQPRTQTVATAENVRYKS
jgi:hypothetical protein